MRRFQAVGWLALAVVSAVLVAGCGGAPTTPAAGPTDFQATAGTANFYSDDAPTRFGLFVLYQLNLENYLTAGIPVVVRGPGGWNNNQPLTLRSDWIVGRRGWWWDWWTFDRGSAATDPCDLTTFVCPAVSGEYTIEATVNGRLNRVRVTVDANAFIGRPRSVTVDSFTQNEVRASWDGVVGAEVWWVRLRDAQWRVLAARYLPANVRSVVFSGVNLQSGVRYHVAVAAFSRDVGLSNPVRFDGQVNFSQKSSGEFSVGPAASSVGESVADRGERQFGSR